MSTENPGATAADKYTIRPYESTDLDSFLRLDQQIWDRNRGPAWFRWKYAENPYTDHTPVFVAERDGEIVGARPFLAFRLQIGEESVVAYQPADTMVHPDHRRNGIFRRMTEQALSTYRDSDPSLFFNFPNQYVRPGYLALGWRAVAPERTYYRVETPTAVRNGEGISQRLLGGLNPIVGGYYAARQRLSTAPTGLTVSQLDGAAFERLVGLHNRHTPRTIHAERTETFLRWRLASPTWERRTYLVKSSSAKGNNTTSTSEAVADNVIAGLVARSRTTNEGLRLTQVVEVAPLGGGDQWRNAVDRGLRAVVSMHPETDLFAVSDGAIPHAVLTGVGFLPDDSVPLSWFTSYDSMLVVRPNGDPADKSAWRFGGRAVDEPANWCVTFAERDTT